MTRAHSPRPRRGVAAEALEREVTVKATDRTTLAEDDVFAFGNLIADTPPGQAGATRAIINVLDLAAVKRHLASANAPVTNPYDFNRDGAVNAGDFVAVRANRFQGLRLITLPATAAAGVPFKRTEKVWAQWSA